MKVKIKKIHPDAVLPKYAKKGDAGLDLTAVSQEADDYGNIHYDTGLAFEIPEGYVGLLFPRSSNAKKNLILSNSVGVIDSNFRSSVSMKFKPSAEFKEIKNYEAYSVGDRIGQIIIMPIPHIEFEEVEELTDTERGAGAYGSSGN